MWRNSTIVAAITLIIGLRSVISPAQPTETITRASSTAVLPSGAHGPQYFSAHIDKVRRVVAGCRHGSVRGDECANAQEAVTEAGGRDRFKKFMGH
jgi:hypothetical protein